jgi:hypothetical protein
LAKPKEEAEVSEAQEGNFDMNTYKIKLDRYGISKAAYDELHSFCLQYDEKLARLNDAYSLKSPNLSGMPHGSGISNPTERAAELCEKYRKDIELIEETAKEVDPKLAPFIIKNVTSDKCPPWVLKTRYGMEAGEKYFCKKRRQFYYVLALKKQII